MHALQFLKSSFILLVFEWTDGSIPDPQGGVVKHKTNEYRQYMNRRGGFNRPLGSEYPLTIFIFVRMLLTHPVSNI